MDPHITEQGSSGAASPLITIAPHLKLRGLRVVPIAKGKKAPVGVMGWQNSNFTVQELADFASGDNSEYAGCGVLLGWPTVNKKSIYMLDVDCPDEQVSSEIAGRLTQWCGQSFMQRVGLAPKFGVPILMYEDSLRKRKTKPRFKDGVKCHVEVLGFGQQVVCYGIHPDTKLPYEWHNGSLYNCDINTLPVLTADDVTAILDMSKDVIASHGYEPNGNDDDDDTDAAASTTSRVSRLRRLPLSTFELDDVEMLLLVLQDNHPDYLDDHDLWVKVGMALHHQFEGSDAALAIWDKWSARSDRYEDGECAKRWRSFNADTAGGVTVRSLLMLPGVSQWWVSRTQKFRSVTEDRFDDISLLVDDAKLTEELTNRYAYFPDEERFYDTLLNVRCSLRFLNSRWARPPADGDNGRPVPRVKPSVLMEKSKSLEILAGLAWHPVDEAIVKFAGKRLLNTYRPVEIAPVAGDITAWLKVCRHVFGEHLETVMDWFAFAVQYPDTKCKWQVLVFGEPRTGKTLAATPWVRLFGEAGKEVSQDMLAAGWGDAYWQTKAIVFEEVWGNGKQFFNSLKSKLVNDNLEALNIKGQSVAFQRNMYAIFCCSNHADALTFAENDDKLLVIRAPDERLPDDDYAALAENIEDIGSPLMQAIYHHLLNRDLSAFSYGKLPVRTQAAIDMSKKSTADWEEELDDRVSTGIPPFDKTVVLVSDVREWRQSHRPAYPMHPVETRLEKLGFIKCRGQKRVNGEVKKTPWFFTTDNLSKATDEEVYDYYMANVSKRKFGQ